MGPELALAIETCATESTSIIISIISKINEVRKFKSKCTKLGKQAQVLAVLLKNNKTAVETFQTLEEFKACLRRIDDFVSSCKSMNVLDVSLEVFVKCTYPSLLKKVNALKDIFLLEAVVRQSVTFLLMPDAHAHAD